MSDGCSIFSQVPQWPSPALFMNASAAIADPLLRQACGRRAHPSVLRRTARVRLRTSGLRAPLSRRGSAISRRTVMNNAGSQLEFEGTVRETHAEAHSVIVVFYNRSRTDIGAVRDVMKALPDHCAGRGIEK